MSDRFGPLGGVAHAHPSPVATAVLLPGMGLGPWIWDAWLGHFHDARLSVVALALPGHGDGSDPTFGDVVGAVEAALDTIDGPIALVGHSMGGLVAQCIADHRALDAVVLVCPMLPAQVRARPTLPQLGAALRLAPAFARGGNVPVPWPIYRQLGLAQLAEADARAVYDRIVPWPGRLLRELVQHTPRPDHLAVASPVLVTLGRLDAITPWQSGRLLGDLYEGLVWRYDDLGHMPMLEPGGARMGRDVAQYCAEPRRPQVLESEGFAPEEGVGHETRRRRRGEAMKKRSAYGQRKAAR